jgi:hypothetical protein
MRFKEHRVCRFRQRLEHREVGERRNKATCQNDGLAADLVGERTKEQEATSTEDQRPCHEDVGGEAVHFHDVLDEEQRIELTRVPDHSLTCREAEQSDQGDLGIAPLTESLAQRSLGLGALFLHLLEGRAFMHLQTNVKRRQQQQNRAQERDAPSPCVECLHHRRRAVGVHGCGTGSIQDRLFRIVAVDIALHQQDDDQRQEQAQGRGGLDECSVVAAAVCRRMFGHIDSRTAIFTTKRQTLKHPQGDQDDWRSDAP